MRLTGSMCALLFAFTACGAIAQGMSVSYLEGEAAIRSGSSWVELSIGDTVSAEASVRLGQGAYVELKLMGANIVLSEKGTYSMRDVLSSRRAFRSAGVGKAVSATLSYMVTGPARTQSAVFGVRGENRSEGDDPSWVTSSAQVFLDAGREYIKSGQYDEAIEQLRQGQDEAAEQESARVRYYLAYAYSLNGDTRNALKQAADLQPTRTDAWAADFVVLKAKLLIDTNAYAQEIEWLTRQENDLSGDAQRASLYYFLLGVGYRGVGDTTNAKQSLSKVAAISGESDLGKAAVQLLQNQ